MIYCVVRRELGGELYGKLVEHYSGDDNVSVIVDRRHGDRRARAGVESPDDSERRTVRDRRRARVAGELLPLAGE